MILVLSWLIAESSYALKYWVLHLSRAQERRGCVSSGIDLENVSIVIAGLLGCFERWARDLRNLRHVRKVAELLKDAIKHIDGLETRATKAKYHPVRSQLVKAKAEVEVSTAPFKPVLESQVHQVVSVS
jgi:hypothetical protein